MESDISIMKCKCIHCRHSQFVKRSRSRQFANLTGYRAFSPLPCDKYTFTVCEKHTSSDGIKYYVKRQPRKPVVSDWQNADFLRQGEIGASCPLNTTQDIFNRMNAQWVADNLYAPSLDLSNAGYFTATRTKRIKEPEGRLHLTEYKDRDVYTWVPSSESKAPPLPHRGQRTTTRLSNDSATLLRRAGVIAQSMGPMVFVTLTYRQSLCQKESKKHLDTFLKALNRYRPGVDWFWVAELTKKQDFYGRERHHGIIHYHIAVLTPFIGVDWLRKTWCRVTHDHKLQPDVKRVNNPANYMAKYMAKGNSLLEPQEICGKRLGFSRALRQELKPLNGCAIPATWDEAKRILERISNAPLDAKHESKGRSIYRTKSGVIIPK